jgi:hypothetical protein
MTSIKIRLTDQILEHCKEFAEAVYDSCSEKYEQRGQSERPLIIQQIMEGKFAEWGVSIYYNNNDLECSEPDHKIYTKKKKSFDADLKRGKFRIHVKSQNQDSINRYGKSWLFQLEDSLFRKANSLDIVVFCVVDLNLKQVEIVYKNQFSKLFFEPPKLAKFRGIKLAVYLENQD